MGLWERLHPAAQDEHTEVDLRDTGPDAEAAGAPAEVVNTWGRPGRCPDCGGHGYLDRVDPVDRIMFQHCTECFHRWSVAEADTVPAT